MFAGGCARRPDLGLGSCLWSPGDPTPASGAPPGGSGVREGKRILNWIVEGCGICVDRRVSTK